MYNKVFKKLGAFALVVILALANLGLWQGRAQAQPVLDAGTQAGNPGDWLTQAQEYIRQSEYQISWVEEPLVEGAPASFQAPNRAQDLRFYFQEAGLQIVRRTESAPAWVLNMALSRVGIRDEMTSLQAPALNVDANRIVYHHGNLVESYTNTEMGLVQTFALDSRPGSKPGRLLALEIQFSGGLTAQRMADGGLEFRHTGQPALHYGNLRAVDAEGRSLIVQEAGINAEETGKGGPVYSLQLVIDDQEASYPVQVTAVISGATTAPNWVCLGYQTTAHSGMSVATAGDVNRDGFSDVIVGVPDYDSLGLVDVGMTFVYYGSANGLSYSFDWNWVGAHANDRLGSSVATAGDVNGDGYSDVIIGASTWDDGAQIDEGKVYVFHGSASGLSLVVNWSYESNQANARLGSTVATAGDVNGDGYSDVILGASDFKSDSPLVTKGRAWVFHGAPGGLVTSPAWYLDGAQENDWLGYSVGTAGDVNGDGYADVLVSAPGSDLGSMTDNGVVYINYGSSTGLSYTVYSSLYGEASYEFLGVSVSTAGDINGDGYCDVIIGSPLRNAASDGGLVRVYHGASYGLSTSLAWHIWGDEAYGKLGWSVATAGDVNSDGYADVIIGQKEYNGTGTDQGRALIWLGSSGGLGPYADTVSSADWQTSLPFDNAQYGYSVATAGDVNGDGYSDVITSAPYYSGNYTEEGLVFVFHGGPDNLSNAADWNYLGSYADMDLGSSVASAGDINGDGYADIIIGAPKYDSSYADEGALFVWNGSMSGPDWSYWFARGNSPNAQLGYAVDSAGDVNGDGYDDIIAGAPYFNNGTQEEGMAFVWQGSASGLGSSGDPSNADWKAESNTFAAALGASVAGAGDLNGDGYADVAVGAPNYSWNQANEGRALVWFGGSDGLGPAGSFSNADWMFESNIDNARLGTSIAGAGDVNRDGYSDLIAGGVDWAFAWYGSMHGLGTLWLDWSNFLPGSHFGASVDTAGDVNGDGYSDVIVGAPWYTGSYSMEGAAYIYCGSVTGLYSSCWSSTGGTENAQFGASAATAGDVNGDGYADIVVGAPMYPNTEVQRGSVRLYYGASAGPVSGSSGDWRLDSPNNYARLGASVGAAGDINGDGYADVLIGAPGTSSNHGQVQLFYGNGIPGKPVRPRQLRANYFPIAHLGRAGSTTFMTQAVVQSPTGRGEYQLHSEFKRLDRLFDGTQVAQTNWFDTSLAESAVCEVTMWNGGQYHWRVRFRYSPVTNPFNPPYSRWYHMPWNGWNEADVYLQYSVFVPFVGK
ncbi:MAG: FG-GAP-like repeat-containing protein [Chloroflexota bacterium]